MSPRVCLHVRRTSTCHFDLGIARCAPSNFLVNLIVGFSFFSTPKNVHTAALPLSFFTTVKSSAMICLSTRQVCPLWYVPVQLDVPVQRTTSPGGGITGKYRQLYLLACFLALNILVLAVKLLNSKIHSCNDLTEMAEFCSEIQMLKLNLPFFRQRIKSDPHFLQIVLKQSMVTGQLYVSFISELHSLCGMVRCRTLRVNLC